MPHKVAIIFFLLLGSISAKPSPHEEQQMKLLLDTADSLFQEEKLSEAFVLYGDFSELYPTATERYYALEQIALIYEQYQYYQKAANVYRQLYQAIGISQSGMAYRLQEARLLAMMGQETEAITILEEIKNLAPESEAANEANSRLQLLRLLPSMATY